MKKKRNITIIILLIAFFGLLGYKFMTRTKIYDYNKGIILTKKESSVTEKEINEKIDEVMKTYAKTVQRKSRSGDIICFSRSATKNKKEVKELHSSYEELKIGEENFVSGFDKHLIGLKKGEHKKFHFTFPKNFKTKKYGGQTYTFSITVKEVRQIPKCTDQFVQEKLFYTNVREMKKKLSSEIKKTKEMEFKSAYEEQAWKKIIQGSTVKQYPKIMLSNAESKLHQYYKSMCKNEGLVWNTFLKQYFGGKKNYEATIKKAAKAQTKENIVLKKICEIEQITLTSKDYKMKAKDLAKQYGYDSLQTFEKNNSKSTIKMVLLKNEALKIIMKNVRYK